MLMSKHVNYKDFKFPPSQILMSLYKDILFSSKWENYWIASLKYFHQFILSLYCMANSLLFAIASIQIMYSNIIIDVFIMIAPSIYFCCSYAYYLINAVALTNLISHPNCIEEFQWLVTHTKAPE